MGAAAAKHPEAARKLRVVVIDDEPDTVVTLLEILRDEGFEAQGYASSREALKGIVAFRPDVIISDLAMPAPTGWDVAREIRNVMGDEPMLIAVSAQYTKDTDKRLAAVVGYNYYLTKPCDPKVLIALIEKARK